LSSSFPLSKQTFSASPFSIEGQFICLRVRLNAPARFEL
jgi:hypothetical protein